MVTPGIFRTDFPEFADTATYSDASINAQLTVAKLRLDPSVWGDLIDYGTELYVAHNLALGRQRAVAATAGALPGAVTGITTSSAVGPVSKSVDVRLGITEGAGLYNLTTYGTQFWQLAESVGVGAVVL